MTLSWKLLVKSFRLWKASSHKKHKLIWITKYSMDQDIRKANRLAVLLTQLVSIICIWAKWNSSRSRKVRYRRTSQQTTHSLLTSSTWTLMLPNLIWSTAMHLLRTSRRTRLCIRPLKNWRCLWLAKLLSNFTWLCHHQQTMRSHTLRCTIHFTTVYLKIKTYQLLTHLCSQRPIRYRLRWATSPMQA